MDVGFQRLLFGYQHCGDEGTEIITPAGQVLYPRVQGIEEYGQHGSHEDGGYERPEDAVGEVYHRHHEDEEEYVEKTLSVHPQALSSDYRVLKPLGLNRPARRRSVAEDPPAPSCRHADYT